MMIKVENPQIQAAIARLGWPRPAEGRVHLIGIRGAVPVSWNQIEIGKNTHNAYDDTVGLFGTKLHLYRGTVDPGAHYTKHPMNPGGCAHLLNGVYRYKRGIHKGKPGLVQAGDVKIGRDRDRDSVWGPGEPVHVGRFAINIHRMGTNPTIEAWSAGCQGIKMPQWLEFYRQVEEARQEVYLYHLMDARDLLEVTR